MKDDVRCQVGATAGHRALLVPLPRSSSLHYVVSPCSSDLLHRCKRRRGGGQRKSASDEKRRRRWNGREGRRRERGIGRQGGRRERGIGRREGRRERGSDEEAAGERKLIWRGCGRRERGDRRPQSEEKG
ncbi:hypothetical protein LINPERPRIM_LOCUS16929, partial [Linum perenne]